jgi:hypothetical protein
MPRRKTHTHEHDTAEGGELTHSPEPLEAGEQEEVNGSHAGTRANGAGAGPPQARPDGAAAAPAPASPTVRRAEEVVDRLAERLGHYAGVVGGKVMWLFARAREEAEDIWEEARALRRGEHPEETSPPPQR